MKNTTGFVTEMPLINKSNHEVIGTSFTIYQMVDGKITFGINAYTNNTAPLIEDKTVLASLELATDYYVTFDWIGTSRYVISDTMGGIISWKYRRNKKVFAEIERHAKHILQKINIKKAEIGFDAIEDKYPEIVL